jgi:PAS domain S-box-containing protein
VLRRWWLYVALIGTPLGFALGLWTGAFPALVRHESFGWVVIWPWSGWSVSFYAYLVSFLFIACVVLVRLWHESQGWRERRRILLVWTTVGATLALGSLTDILLPALNAFGVPELASSFSLIWAVGLYLSVTRYGLMSPASQAAAATTLETMADAVVLMSVEGVVDAVNPVFEALTGRPPAGVVGRPAADLFTRPDLASEEVAETRLSSRLRTFRLDCRTETGTGLPVSVSARTTRVGAPARRATSRSWRTSPVSPSKAASTSQSPSCTAQCAT